MNRYLDDSISVPTLLNRLCSKIANHDPVQSAEFLKLTLNFLANSKPINSSNVEEIYVVEKIRRHLSSQPAAREKIRNFELLYNKLKKITVLKRRCAALTFLYYLTFEKNDTHSWLILKELKQFDAHSDNSTRDSFEKIFPKSSSHFEINDTQFTALSSNDSQIKSTETFKSCIYGNVSEKILIQELIFSFQGIEGKILRKEPGSGGFIIDPRIGISRSQRAIVKRLIELGFLHNQIRQHCESNKQIGVIGQSLIAALREELTEYYKLIAVLQSQLKTHTEYESDQLTLRRLLVWVAEPQFRLQWLANIALECQNKKGGALISSVYAFLQHGAPVVQTLIRRILKAICLPLFRMMTRWLLDGYLEDSCGEFFIEVRSGYKEQRLWHDKYHVRSNMLPTFISVEQANKILITGKSINFIREVCQDLSNLPGREVMQRTFENFNIEALFTAELSIELHNIIDSAYHEISDRVLDIMKGENHLIEHMQAFRRYLLLGQGDFIRRLLELLAPELSKPATNIYPHTLSAILDSAIRVTNAQYENPETLKRLDVRLMEVSQGDFGWDVFTVLYHIDGPIGTIFEPTLETYRTLFGALWKAKRMEFILSGMWKRQITSTKLFRKLKDVAPVMQHIHILTSEMVHFIHQTQYYFLFEVLECSWAEMLNKVNVAESLDDVIKAHNNFLQSVQRGVLVDSSSQELYTHLCTIYNTILKLDSMEESLYNSSLIELETINKMEEKIKASSSTSGFGLTKDDDRKHTEQITKFNLYLMSVKTHVRSIAKQYNDYVRKYLDMLASHSDMNLQLLSVRLDFSGYYERVEESYVNRRKFSVK